jgi:hypothetical protein
MPRDQPHGVRSHNPPTPEDGVTSSSCRPPMVEADACWAIGADLSNPQGTIAWRPFPRASEGGLNVFILAVSPQAQPQAKEELLIILGRGIEVPEKGCILQNVQPTFTQHLEYNS